MKGLDTPILLAILRGEALGRNLLKKLHGEEICTTEVNLFELEVLARGGPSRGRDRRLSAVESLRRKMTVLSLDEASARSAAQLISRATPAEQRASGELSWLILGGLEAIGCTEWYTSKESRFPLASKRVRIHILGN